MTTTRAHLTGRYGHEHDVIVVGARCAGAPLAMLLARDGHDVLVVDRADLPSDTLSTHAIARGGVVMLHRWGLLDEVVASGAPEIRSVSFHVGDAPPVVRTIKCANGVDHLLAPRRHILDDILLREAWDAGATVRTGVAVTRVETAPDGRVCGVRMRDREGRETVARARFVVGADGVHSRVARAVGARVIDERPALGAAHYTYVSGLDGEGFEFHIGVRGFAGVFRTHDGEANVWVCVPEDRGLRGLTPRTHAFLALLADISPTLAARVERGAITAPVRGAIGLPNHAREAAGPGWALCGDAGYHRDPITGHGITDAFRDAHLLAVHLGSVLTGATTEASALHAYGTERLGALQPIFDLTCELVAYPEAERFVALQRELSAAIDAEASWLESLPGISADGYVAA
jgi:flavin-dependent dehydrogenase